MRQSKRDEEIIKNSLTGLKGILESNSKYLNSSFNVLCFIPAFYDAQYRINSQNENILSW